MTRKTRSTVHMICARVALASDRLPEEAQKLLELYEDPNVAPEQKKIVKAELDEAIRKLEEKVTTRKLREAKSNKSASEPSDP